MHTLQIEHSVESYEAWKATFDSDPLGRAREGVISYRIYQPLDDPKYVVVDLVFEDSIDAEAFHVMLRDLWKSAEQEGLIAEVRARILKEVEAQQL